MPDLFRGRSGTVLLLGVLAPLVLGAAAWVVVDSRSEGPEGYLPPHTAEQDGPSATGESEEALPERRRQQYVAFARRAVDVIVSGDAAAAERVTTPGLGALLADLPLGLADVEVRAAGLAGGDRSAGEVLVVLGGRATAPVLVTVDATGERLRLSDVAVDLSTAAGPGEAEDDPARRRALEAAARVVANRGSGEVLAAGLASYARDRVGAVVAVEGPAGPAGVVVQLVRENGRWKGLDAEVVR